MFDETKFRELVLHIADRCEAHTHYGVTKLNKILFMADFLAYRNLGRSITGATYIADTFGPVPEPMNRVRESMRESGEIAIKQAGSERRVIALRDPNVRLFTAEEILLISVAIEEFQPHTARYLSELTHGFSGWLAAWRESQASGKAVVIPYESILIEAPNLDPFEEVRILDMAEKRGWLAGRSIGTKP